MSKYSLTHLGDRELLRDLAALVARERSTTATLLAHIAEVDERRLYLPAAHPSMYSYCVHELRLSEEAAFKRIRVARAARQFPAIFVALAEGRVHLSGLVLLASHLTPENAGELLAAAEHKTRSEIEQLLAERFPRPAVPTRVEAISALSSPTLLSELSPGTVEGAGEEHASGRAVGRLAPGTVEARVPRPVAPLSPERFALRVTIGQGTHDNLRYAQALLGHAVPAGDVAEVLDRALVALVGQLEKQKFAATTRPRPQRSSADPRHIPAHVKRTVWERDGGQCTFVGEAGQRCASRTRLEFDHIDPVARGGEATVSGVRLHCRSHNQYEAECTFGTAFMCDKRDAARQAAAEKRARAAADKERARARAAAEQDPERSVVPWLRKLGFRADEARRAAERCEAIPDASLEERVRFALTFLGPPCRAGENSPRTAT
jgi:hypothetical protein